MCTVQWRRVLSSGENKKSLAFEARASMCVVRYGGPPQHLIYGNRIFTRSSVILFAI